VEIGWPPDYRPVALVTGAAQGIGRAIAEHFLGRAIDVIAVDIRDPAFGRDVAADAATWWRYVSSDLSDSEARSRLSGEVGQFVDRVDILVNCAGVLYGTEGWADETLTEMRAMLEINYLAAIDLCQQFVPGMVSRRRGRVVNMSSIYGRLGSPNVVTYSATKAALLTLTRSLAAEVGRSGVTVNCISPGHIDTPMTRSGGEDYIADVVSRTPVSRLGAPEEVARAVAFLVDSPFINGADIVIDGGLSIVAG
jgi:NAD(P)-dependent dehydrogenase (short-subunit alcohol dehydrogenase family)